MNKYERLHDNRVHTNVLLLLNHHGSEILHDVVHFTHCTVYLQDLFVPLVNNGLVEFHLLEMEPPKGGRTQQSTGSVRGNRRVHSQGSH